jgi:hypothetical protein
MRDGSPLLPVENGGALGVLPCAGLHLDDAHRHVGHVAVQFWRRIVAGIALDGLAIDLHVFHCDLRAAARRRAGARLVMVCARWLRDCRGYDHYCRWCCDTLWSEWSGLPPPGVRVDGLVRLRRSRAELGLDHPQIFRQEPACASSAAVDLGQSVRVNERVDRSMLQESVNCL